MSIMCAIDTVVEMRGGGIAGIAWRGTGILQDLGICHGATKQRSGALFLDLDQAVHWMTKIKKMSQKHILNNWNI